jgi:stage IV sporulation protein FB
VLLSESPPTPLDLRFRLFGVPVRVHPLFWLMSAILGWNLVNHPVISDNGMLELAVWILACFVSILLHEFGHVWMGQVFGAQSHILLQGMGGLAIGANNLRSGWQRVLVLAAGPGIQLLLWGALWGALWAGYRPEPRTPMALLVYILLTINLFWPLLNLLPIWPLDGGQITREVCAGLSPRNGSLTAFWISLVISATLAINALMGEKGEPFIPYSRPFTGMWLAIFFALFAVGSWQMIQVEQQSRYRSSYDDDLPWER